MSNPTSPRYLRVHLNRLFPEGDTKRYAKKGWDESRFKPAGFADVVVEVQEGEWRPRRIGVLVDEDGKLWAHERFLLGPIRKRPAMAREVNLTPQAPTPAPKAPVPVPAVPRPTDAFLARFGVFPKS